MEEIERLLGAEAMQKLIAAYAGCVIHIPKTINHGHRLTVDIGLLPALQLSKHYGGSQLYIKQPKPDTQARNDEIVRQRHSGKSCIELARQYSLSGRAILRIISTHQQGTSHV
jgi:Mor family transcriptional regulator